MPDIFISTLELSGLAPEAKAAANVRVDFSPYQAWVVETDDGDAWLTRNILRVRLPEGSATVPLLTTPAGNAYEVQERGFRGAQHGYKVITDSDTNYADIPWVNKDDLSPILPPSPAWVAEAEALAADIVTAQSTADSAGSAAGAASSLASTAKSTADSAVAAAAAAQSTADGVVSDLADKANTTALDAETTARLALADSIPDTVDTAIATHIPGAQLGKAERLTTATTTAASSGTATDVSSFSVGPIRGTGRPVSVELECSSIGHATANTLLYVAFAINGVLDVTKSYVWQGRCSIAVNAANPLKGTSVFAKLPITLTDGVDYTFTIRPYSDGVAGTIYLGAQGFQKMTMEVIAR